MARHDSGAESKLMDPSRPARSGRRLTPGLVVALIFGVSVAVVVVAAMFVLAMRR